VTNVPAAPDTKPPNGRGLALRIGLVALAVSAVAVGILAVGVWVIGGDTFERLMVDAGDSAEHAQEMFDHSLRDVILLAVVVAIATATTLGLLLAARLSRPLAEVGAAARRVAGGDYAARVPRRGPDEIASLADSFNQMAASLEEGQRLRRDLIANTAHELRTPLTNLSGYLEGLRDGVIPADPATFDSLLEETERLTRLSRALDDLAEGDRSGRSARLVEVDLGLQLGSAVDLARPGLEARGIGIERAWPNRLPARADPDQLAQVLANLLQNATRYTPDGGLVTVAAEPRSDTVLVSVVNSGEGIPADDLPHVFERFYRVEKSRDRARGGAGVGLAIVRQLVEGWGGRVGAESEEGLTRVWFSLPRG
jgi:two-component system, OmpR family, sensor histidine kinase BaeS